MSAFNKLRLVATNNANPMRNTETQPNYYETMKNAEYANKMAAEKNFQGLYETVYSKPSVTGKASNRFVARWNYFGYLDIYNKDPSVKYNVGLPTGGGVPLDVFPPLLPPKKFSLGGR
jgi:hypothetical protein